MNKIEIRKIYKAKRLALSENQYQMDVAAIHALFFGSIDFTSVRVVHCYLPVLDRKEVNTFLILKDLEKRYPLIQIQVPKILNDTMLSVLFKNGDLLEANSFGVLEPKDWQQSLEIPDLVITPLLAFDGSGYRVGYGGGYYDKFFAALPPNVLKIGLSIFPSIDQIEDLDEFDIPLDICITPEKIYEFKYGY